MSYLVGYGDDYPGQVYHRGASIPVDGKKYSCQGGQIWRDSARPNPNTITGAMVGGTDENDGFHDVRRESIYTEPSIVGNAGLMAALVAVSVDKSIGIDVQTMNHAMPCKQSPPPPPPPWQP